MTERHNDVAANSMIRPFRQLKPNLLYTTNDKFSRLDFLPQIIQILASVPNDL